MTLRPTNPEYFIPSRFEGKTLLITGAATGIGAATAVRAAREGARVAGVDKKAKEASKRRFRKLQKRGIRPLPLLPMCP